MKAKRKEDIRIDSDYRQMAEQRDSAGFINRSDLWPNWPVCSLKRIRDERTQCGFVGEFSDVTRSTVYLGYIFDLSKMDTMEKIVYATVESMLADGWEVDGP